ncbi:hypothetical protein BKG91_02510 [Rodentibacter caecimuris]|uniref:Uncharacterized protein n=2 Tax=Rodentibacter caecimuris TaxID=1796644 RepID=A0AAJ3K393_9PAST|nr:hypothetical protein BKG90_06010 [Rodentibacter heylii]OOF75727.1 hypothetical protein BKG91_02510 [Rodentibacter heylii]OOF77241.1 hypothetical protein BKG99_03680 [Rodentibacter heylii]
MNEYLKHQGAPVLARLERLLKFALKSLQKACRRGEGLLAIFRAWFLLKNRRENRVLGIVGIIVLI